MITLRRHGILVALVSCLALGAMGAPARAGKKEALAAYQEGEKQYNLGNFTKAAEKYKEAYNEWPDGAFLFNVGQAYRMASDCKNSVFFYKRFLSVAKNIDPKLEQETNDRITELEKACDPSKPPSNGPGPDKGNGDGDGDKGNGDGDGDKGDGDKGNADKGNGDKGNGDKGNGTGDKGNSTGAIGDGDDDDDDDDDLVTDDDDDDGSLTATATTPPRLISIGASGGGAMVGIGSLDVPVQLGLGLTGGYPLALNDKMVLELGAFFGFTPVPWDNGSGATGTASLISTLANLGTTYAVSPKIGLRGDLGLGALHVAGLSMGNVFTRDGRSTTGPATMFNLRLAASIDYALTPNLIARLTPIAFSFSPASAEVFDDDITSFTRVEFLIGLAYRM